MKSTTYAIMTRPALYWGLERSTIIIIAVISLIGMWLTHPLTLIFIYIVLHGIAFVITHKDPDFMAISLLRIFAFGKGRYEP